MKAGGLRIVHVTNTFRIDGTGITNVVADLAIGQARAGHRVVVVCSETDDRLSALAARDGVIVVSGVSVTSLADWARTAARLSRDRRVSEHDIVHVHTVRATALVALAFPRSFLRRSVSTVHNGFQRSVVAMCTTRAVVCVSDGEARSIRRRTVVRHPLVIRNGTIGSPRTAPIDQVTPARLSHPAIVYVGALAHRKGIDVLLTAMRDVLLTHPGARLYLVGNRDNPRMEALADRLGIGDSVVFAGFRSDPRAEMLAADVVVLPSRAEPFGLVLLEARESGAAIVASDVGGIKEALSGGAAGRLVVAGDVRALGSALTAILDDPAHGAALRAGTAVGLNWFSVDRMCASYLGLYRWLALRSDPGAITRGGIFMRT